MEEKRVKIGERKRTEGGKGKNGAKRKGKMGLGCFGAEKLIPFFPKIALKNGQ